MEEAWLTVAIWIFMPLGLVIVAVVRVISERSRHRQIKHRMDRLEDKCKQLEETEPTGIIGTKLPIRPHMQVVRCTPDNRHFSSTSAFAPFTSVHG